MWAPCPSSCTRFYLVSLLWVGIRKMLHLPGRLVTANMQPQIVELSLNPVYFYFCKRTWIIILTPDLSKQMHSVGLHVFHRRRQQLQHFLPALCSYIYPCVAWIGLHRHVGTGLHALGKSVWEGILLRQQGAHSSQLKTPAPFISHHCSTIYSGFLCCLCFSHKKQNSIFTIETVRSYIKQKHTLEKSLILEWS